MFCYHHIIQYPVADFKFLFIHCAIYYSHGVTFVQKFLGSKWPFMCSRAIMKLLTHTLVQKVCLHLTSKMSDSPTVNINYKLTDENRT